LKQNYNEASVGRHFRDRRLCV